VDVRRLGRRLDGRRADSDVKYVYYERCVRDDCDFEVEDPQWTITTNNRPCPKCLHWTVVAGSRREDGPEDSTAE
jgi:hypothetical protein